MEANLRSAAGLYQQLLGESWWDLDEPIRQLHSSSGTVRAAGTFQVQHGSNRLARLLARLAQLPAAGETVALQLQIITQEGDETWLRTFAGRPMVTVQSRRSGGLLVERRGPVEMRFRLEVIAGALHYQTVSVTVGLGALRMPLPRWLRPSITAWEKSADAKEQIDVSVAVQVPWLGRLIAYNGRLSGVEVSG
jgi:hypothetical protein